MSDECVVPIYTGYMDGLIPLINRIQDIFTLLGEPLLIRLPTIVVVGSQSSGKSSVLESIVGREFLPRGSGIVTRRPLILQLVQTKGTEEWGEFLHSPQKFHSFPDILAEIELKTRELLGTNRGVSSEPLNLKVHSPHVVDLTLVDLPGITKNPVGDQPRDIEQLIKQMILEYISSPNSLILAISPANQDLQNSDALYLAREVDPAGKRTLGVITKLDIMDRGTNALNMLSGRELPLALGYVGVICRSQQDINEGKSISTHLHDEEQFFQQFYGEISHRMGTSFLSKALNQLLLSKIKEGVPAVKHDLIEKLRETEEELRTLGFAVAGNPQVQSVLLLNIIHDFIQKFSTVIEGNFLDRVTDALRGGSRIHQIFFT